MSTEPSQSQTTAERHETSDAQMSRAERKAYYENLPKPKARGWIHAAVTPLALLNGILLVIFAPTTPLRIACAVFALSGLLLFGNSAIYHTGNHSERVRGILQQIDHANIYILIAGTYTPLSVGLLEPRQAAFVLAIVWGGAIIGIGLQVFFPNAPRWAKVILYIALGWVAVWFLPEFWRTGGPAIVWLLIAGGVAYTVGALFYAFRWPNPWPKYFGFHEFFHVGTAIGYACHSVAVWLTLFL